MLEGLASALLAVLATAGALAGIRAFWVEPRSLRITEIEVASSSWPAKAPPLRLALLADLHTAGPHASPERLARAVARTNEARPDLVLLLGDYVVTDAFMTSFVPPERTARVLAGLRAPLGVFAVLGNHDWHFDGPAIRRALEDAGIPVLENEARQIRTGGLSFWLAGVGDSYVGRADLAGTLWGVDDDAPVVVMSHSPDLFPEVPERVALTLAGHTHGGQVRLPLLGRPVVPSRFGARYAQGHIVERGRHLVVSAGIGHSVLPVRFGVPPEIVLVTLTGLCGRPSDARRISGPSLRVWVEPGFVSYTVGRTF